MKSNKNHPIRPLLLVVEDEPFMAQLLVEILKNGGYEYHQAIDYQEVIKKMQNHHCDAVNLSLMAPSDSGINSLSEIYNVETTPELLVIVVSTKINQGKFEIKGAVLKMVEWIQKPIHEEVLLKAVKHTLNPLKNNMSILYLGDNSGIASIINTQLNYDYQVEHTESLMRAKQLLKDKNFDLVIHNINLPDGSAENLLSVFNSLEYQTLMIIFMAQDINEGVAAQVKGAVVKLNRANKVFLQLVKSVIKNYKIVG